MARPRQEYDGTTNRSVYNKAKKQVLEHDGEIICSYCRYHHHENDGNHWYYIDEYKGNSRIPSWKLVTKNAKQWMPKKYDLRRLTAWRDQHEYLEIVISR